MSLVKGRPSSTPRKKRRVPKWFVWLEEHPLATSSLSLLTLLLTAILAIFVFSFHAQDAGRIAGERAGRIEGRAASQQVIDKGLCPLVKVYRDLPPALPDPLSQHRAMEVTAGWATLGELVGCK